MANRQSVLITGANARVKINGKTLAYATDVSYNIVVQTIPIETMGTYEVRDNVPVAYTVDGTFSIVRYTREAANLTNAVDDPATAGNSPIRITSEGSESTLGDHLNPSKLLTSGTFDLQIMEQLTNAAGSESETKDVFTVSNCRLTRRGMTLNKRGVYVDQYAYVGILATDDDVDITEKVAGSGIGPDLG